MLPCVSEPLQYIHTELLKKYNQQLLHITTSVTSNDESSGHVDEMQNVYLIHC